MKVLGGATKNLKALSSSSTSRFFLPFRTCLPMGWCCKTGLEPPPLPWEKSCFCCPLQGESEPGKRAARGGGGWRGGLAFHLGAEVIQEGHPWRSWGQGVGNRKLLDLPIFSAHAPKAREMPGLQSSEERWLWSWSHWSESWMPRATNPSVKSG